MGSRLCGSHCLARIVQLGLQPRALLLAKVRGARGGRFAPRQLLPCHL